MCTLQKPKKRFDYEAYIQGRLVGKYVVIYHEEVDETFTQDIIENPDLPSEDTEVTTVLPKDSSPVIFERIVHRVDFTLPYRNTDPIHIGLPNPKGLNVYEGRLAPNVKPMMACSRAGPN
jgi:hypothetical protein